MLSKNLISQTCFSDGIGYKVECVGYATMKFNGPASETIFGISVTISGIENKTFSIQDEDGSTLGVSPFLNQVEFNSKPLTATPYEPADLKNEKMVLEPSAPGHHKFKLDEETCFEHTDVAGNIFNISYDGAISTELANTHVVQNLDNFYRQNEVGPYHEVEEKHKPAMRLFVVHSDQTGTEIMDLPKCKGLFDAPGNNPDIVKVEEDVESDDLAQG